MRQERFNRDIDEISYRCSKFRDVPEATILRKIVSELPPELLTEDNRELVRSTVYELLKLHWNMHMASGAMRFRWRFACTEGEEEEEDVPGLRAYFILAGEGLDFVPSKFVDRERIAATAALSAQQLRRMSSEDWAGSVAAPDQNVNDVLKRVPAGWTTFLKGDAWPGMKGQGAVYRLQRAKRIFIQIDFVSGKPEESKAEEEGPAQDSSDAQGSSEQVPSTLLWLGPLAGFAAGLLQLARNSPPFVFGQERRREVDEVLRALQRRPEESTNLDVSKFEQRLWMDFGDAEEAPVVLVVGGQSPTGKIISRKLVTSGYHVVLLKAGSSSERVEKLTPQGTTLSSESVVPTGTYANCGDIPNDLYGAVAGIDKLVICQCDDDPDETVTEQHVKNVLSCWQIYRFEFADTQRAYATKVRLFRFDRDTDFDLWDVESDVPSDVCYGGQSTSWKRVGPDKLGQWIGGFSDPVGQALLKSPKLKLNFKRFGGLVLHVYNSALDNKYSMFLRTSDFEETRLQYECDFECKGTRWHRIRMPFNAFRAIRADGVELPADEQCKHSLDRADVVQMGICKRTGENPKMSGRGQYSYFSLVLVSVMAFRIQAEPQVIFLRQQDSSDDKVEEEEEEDEEIFSGDLDIDAELSRIMEAEEEAAAEIEELVGGEPATDDLQTEAVDQPAVDRLTDDAEIYDEILTGRVKHPANAVVESGLAYTMITIKGLNEHPGGRFPVSVQQASVKNPPLTEGTVESSTISRGDLAELAVSALAEPMCVNTEILVGESPRGTPITSTFQISSTMQEDVKTYFKQLMPNR